MTAAKPDESDDWSALPTVRRIVEDGLGRLHLGLQFCVSHRGRIVANVAIGEQAPGVPMTVETIVPWLSTAKPLTAAAILKLSGDSLSLEDPVSDWIPEFARGGKSGIRVVHLLTHTSGLPVADSGWPALSWTESLEKICSLELPPDVAPGTVAAYQPTATWLLLGEILARATGNSYDDAMKSLVLQSAGLQDVSCGMSEFEWRKFLPRLGELFERDRAGILVETGARTQERCTRASPGAGFRGPIRELVRFYDSLAGAGDRLLPDAQLSLMTNRRREGMFDRTLQHLVDYGLGVIVDSNRYGMGTVPYGFGRHCSPTTFGHGGAQCAMGFIDPQNELIVAWAANGRPGEPQHQKRNRAINEAIYRDLGLATDG